MSKTAILLNFNTFKDLGTTTVISDLEKGLSKAFEQQTVVSDVKKLTNEDSFDILDKSIKALFEKFKGLKENVFYLVVEGDDVDCITIIFSKIETNSNFDQDFFVSILEDELRNRRGCPQIQVNKFHSENLILLVEGL